MGKLQCVSPIRNFTRDDTGDSSKRIIHHAIHHAYSFEFYRIYRVIDSCIKYFQNIQLSYRSEVKSSELFLRHDDFNCQLGISKEKAILKSTQNIASLLIVYVRCIDRATITFLIESSIVSQQCSSRVIPLYLFNRLEERREKARQKIVSEKVVQRSGEFVQPEGKCMDKFFE